jgi:hypothetical protein
MISNSDVPLIVNYFINDEPSLNLQLDRYFKNKTFKTFLAPLLPLLSYGLPRLSLLEDLDVSAPFPAN